MSATIDTVLEAIDELEAEDQAEVLEILTRRRIEKRRAEIRDAGEAAMEAFRNGRLRSGTVEDLWKDLNA